MDDGNELALYHRDPEEWGAAVGPKLLEAIRSDKKRGLDWSSRWVWVETKACAALHRSTLQAATSEERAMLWREEPLRAKVVVMQLSESDMQKVLWSITSIEDRQNIRELALRGRVHADEASGVRTDSPSYA